MAIFSGETSGEADWDEPFGMFSAWLEEARRGEPDDPDAAALASVDGRGVPNVRMVLVRHVDARGFVFYTNLESAKGGELRAQPHAALCFHWKSLHRQVRVRGGVTPVSDEEADEYFASRPRGSRIGAWASKQSRPLQTRFELEKRVAEFGVRYGVGEVPRPEHWSGFRLRPEYIEFWRQGKFRLHERLVYRCDDGDVWKKEMLFP